MITNNDMVQSSQYNIRKMHVGCVQNDMTEISRHTPHLPQIKNKKKRQHSLKNIILSKNPQ